MQTLKLSVSLPDETHPDMQLCVSTDELACDVVISVLMGAPAEPAASSGSGRVQLVPRASIHTDTRAVDGLPVSTDATASAADDAYTLGGYAGI